MRKTLISLGFLLILVGCGTQGDPRLMVDDDLRAKCYVYSDDEIRVFISAAEDDRLAGGTATDEFLAIATACQAAPPGYVPCYSCLLAVINKVWGL